MSLARFLAHLMAVAIFATPLAALAQSPSGTISGVVLDRETQQPVGNATVTVVGLTLGANAGENGRFVIRNVPLGSHRLRAWRLDYAAVILSDVVVTPGRETDVRLELNAEAVPQAQVEVRASGFARPKEQATSSYQMSNEEIRRSPGAIGDVFRLVQSLPGVVNTNDQRNDIVARGGSPAENLILIDNIEVPTLNHFASQGTSGGPISMLNNDLVRDASFQAGGFPAIYGEKLSSVMDIRLRDGNRDRFQSETDINSAGYGQVLEGPLGPRGSYLATARQSFYDLVAKPFGLTAIPYTTNGQLKLVYEPGTRDRLWFVNVTGTDRIKLKHDADASDAFDIDFASRGWRTTNGASWQRLFGDWGWGTLALSDSYGAFIQDILDFGYGGLPIFHNHSGEGESQLRYDVAARTGATGDWKAGVSLRRDRYDYAIDQPFGVPDPFSPDTTRVQALSLGVRGDVWTGATYLQWTRTFAERADLTLGGRVTRFDGLHATTADPRAVLTLHLTPFVEANLSYGRYHQSPALVFVESYPENASLLPITAEHRVAGLAWTPSADVKVSLEAYRKDYRDYPVARDYPTFSLANSGDIYGVNGLLFPLVSAGHGRADGVEFYLQKKLTTGAYGQVSYGRSRVRHAALDGVLRRGAFDAPNTGTAILGWKPNARWEASTRFSYVSGRPYTPPLQPLSYQQNRYVYDIARTNAARATPYHRLDVRCDRRFTLWGRYATLWFEAQNVYNRKNVFQYLWNTETRSLESVAQIRFLPVLGFNVEL